MLKRIKTTQKLMLVLLLTAGPCVSEPWLDTRDAGLRADIERLSAAGAVTVPINTWPLMWSGILNDLHAFDVQQYPDLQASYGRVMVEANKALRSTAYSASAKLSFTSESELLRHFGSDSRDEGSLRLRRNGLSKHFAYNLEITQINNPWDGDQTHYDNSYFGFVWGTGLDWWARLRSGGGRAGIVA